jgi:hypothetical protein
VEKSGKKWIHFFPLFSPFSWSFLIAALESITKAPPALKPFP